LNRFISVRNDGALINNKSSTNDVSEGFEEEEEK
jgi:hypothetical protein